MQCPTRHASEGPWGFSGAAAHARGCLSSGEGMLQHLVGLGLLASTLQDSEVTGGCCTGSAVNAWQMWQRRGGHVRHLPDSHGSSVEW